MVEYWTHNSHSGSFASNLEQVANLLCAQADSAFYPQWDEKWLVAYGCVADWGGGMSAYCIADPIVH